MSKPPTVFKRASNRILQFIADGAPLHHPLPSEQSLAVMCHVSRTAVRSALVYLVERGVISDLMHRSVVRTPVDEDYFDLAELQSGPQRIQQVLMERVFLKDMPPGAEFSEAELAREAEASTVSVREFLIGFERFGLIEKKPRGGWRLCAFDLSFATELADMREMFELRAVAQFMTLDKDDPKQIELRRLIKRHEALQPRIATEFGAFPALDRDFHTFLIGLLNNRFAQGFYDIVSFVFHYHYQWDKSDEMERNRYAIGEHLAILRALADGDKKKAIATMSRHLQSSRQTLIASIHSREQKLLSSDIHVA
jgi:DNA-binding GntR family transcriptional regulator